MSDGKNNPDKSKAKSNFAPQPDKADFHDDEFDVPTYKGPQTSQKKSAADSDAKTEVKADFKRDAESASEGQRTTIFQRAGRAAPQTIEPNSGASRNRADSTGPGNDSEPTTQFAQQSSAAGVGSSEKAAASSANGGPDGNDNQVDADSQRPEYRDEDFATTEVIDPAGKQTTVPVAASAIPNQAAQSNNTPSNNMQPGPTQPGQPHDGQQQFPDDVPYAQGNGIPNEEAAGAGAMEHAELTETRRGTIDFGLFLLRIVFSAWLIIQAVGTFFSLGNHEGIAGLESEFSAYNQDHLLAILVPALQLAAGIFLLLGLLAPIAGMVAVTVSGFLAVHQLADAQVGLNIFNWEETLWVPVMVAAIAVVVQFTGPGLYALDGARGWARRPLASSWIFAILGIAAVVAAWWLFAGTNPLAS
ncbi:DoxX family protein [Corynebacterium propinquum]|uniref:DoxX family protein n=1 Tax=Corynebacterium propinquum TaxID=43769 RepID=A0ABT7G107_9CORY|nr:DoxX family protein [Corynebacterium propinquum]MCG7231713.1 DoxX family protein [Corynebacterium propinquum]MCT1817518.1 DoxX family protein [Corynebacterium propinquum]MDK4238767.1 DoxX family protein [Corynebacterium propinquum]MDK4251068.1 DoxX family protein [Corynebacterium propinquum]MDK4300409.1 DoxX family protein [Corynebacterium propinquum]